MRPIMSAFASLLCVACFGLAQESDGPDPAALAKAFQDADATFTAMVGKVQPKGMTNSIPASIFGEVTFKDMKALRGPLPATTKFSFSYRENATAHMDLMATGAVVVAVKQKGVSVVVPATDANKALAKKTSAKE